VGCHAGLATTTPAAYGSLRDVKRSILSGSSSHHLSQVTHIIRYCNNLVEYDVSYAEGKYNSKDLTIVFTKVTSISIHQLSSYKIYKRCHMTFVQVAELNPPIKKQKEHKNFALTPWATSKVTCYQTTC
jgi:hypothetical protein